MIGLFSVIILGVVNVGSFSEIFSRSVQGGRLFFNFYDVDIYTSNNFWVVILGTTFFWIAVSSCNQLLIQRTCCFPTIKQAKQKMYYRVVYFSIPGFIINITQCSLIGLTLYAYYYKCDPVLDGSIKRIDELVPFFIRQEFHSFPGLTGLFVVCILSASFSTLSSGFNAIAALFWEDIFAKRLPNIHPSKAVLITKIIAALAGLLCIGLAFLVKEIGTIFEAAFALSAAPIGPLFAIFSMGLFVPFVNSHGAVVGLISGQLLCFVINFGGLIFKSPSRLLLSSNENCFTKNSTFIPFSNLTNNQIPHYSPQGWNRLFHISYFIVPMIGYFTALFLGIIVSLLTGGSNVKNINPILVNSYVRKYMQKSIAQDNAVELDNLKTKY
ncbi:sodium-coupled monocarboxylate transporter 1-like isoform X2, partial [Leptotrombidium deliense]